MKINWNYITIGIGFIGIILLIAVAYYKETEITTVKFRETILEDNSISIVHDYKRNVICYKSHDGLSCIKDQ